jgi:cell division protein FtsL
MALFGKKKKEANSTESVSKETVSKKEKASELSTKTLQPKPKADIYTLLLGLSVAALVVAIVLLFLNLNAYGPDPLSGIPK